MCRAAAKLCGKISALRLRRTKESTVVGVSPLPPSARPDFQLEDTLCANSSESCAAIQQAKQQSYQKFRAQQLASEVSREQDTAPISFNSKPSKAAVNRRKGLQLFQLLTSRFRRRAQLPECIALERIARRLRTIAIVGNGPISIQQRQQIQTADVVIRFNKLNNRFCGERLDVWVVRFGNTTESGYHGVNEVTHCTTAEAIGRLSSLWFLDNKPGWARQHAMDTIVQNFTEAGWMEDKTWLGIDKRPLTDEFHQTMDKGTTPSSGWIGLRLAERCRPWGARIHLFGYNWSPLAWSGHKMSEEHKYAQTLEAEGKLIIHRPPCRGFRTCDGCAVVAGFDAKNNKLACAEHVGRV
ncbi:hypothetical protein WJX84_011150 [Apatococcus fuscideae]|uniref:Uncharacterized protein n=1 Tax=Apatococcus fuscideae TaxID=2026836 RepID=A0AAW1T8B4_9CHLO